MGDEIQDRAAQDRREVLAVVTKADAARRRAEHGTPRGRLARPPAGVGRAAARELRRYRQFYLTCPQIRESLSPELGRTLRLMEGA